MSLAALSTNAALSALARSGKRSEVEGFDAPAVIGALLGPSLLCGRQITDHATSRGLQRDLCQPPTPRLPRFFAHDRIRVAHSLPPSTLGLLEVMTIESS